MDAALNQRETRIEKTRAFFRNQTFLRLEEGKQISILRQLLQKGLLYDDLRMVLQEERSPLLLQFPDLQVPVVNLPRQLTPPRPNSAQRALIAQEVAQLKETASIDCAKFLTRTIKELNGQQRQTVIDYLTNIGVDIQSNTKAMNNSRELCVFLLEKLMLDEYGNKVPVTAYANNILQKAQQANEIKQEQEKELEQQRREEEDRLFVEQQEREMEERRIAGERQHRLDQHKQKIERDRVMRQDRANRARTLATVDVRSHSCTLASGKIFSVVPYNLVVNPNTGMVAGMQIAGVSLPYELFTQIAESGIPDPVLEITTGAGVRAYARQTDAHPPTTKTPKGDPIVFVSPPLAKLLQINPKNQITLATIKLCTFLPKIAAIELAYYGTDLELSKYQLELQEALSRVITSYSYLSLGMVLSVDLEDDDGNMMVHEARVDVLLDENNDSIFVGLLPIGNVTISPTITPDVI